MQIFRRSTSWALAAAGALTLLAGCSNAGSSQLPSGAGFNALRAGLVALDDGVKPVSRSANDAGLVFLEAALKGASLRSGMQSFGVDAGQ